MRDMKKCNASIGFVIKDLSNMMKRRMDHEVFDDMDEHMSGIQGWVISFIYDEGSRREIYQRDIEQEFNIRRSSVTGLLKTMEKNGLIRREAVERDARLKKITLTTKAIENRKMISQRIQKFDRELEAGITPEERESFMRTALKIHNNLESGEK